jgi:hypothetical protein
MQTHSTSSRTIEFVSSAVVLLSLSHAFAQFPCYKEAGSTPAVACSVATNACTEVTPLPAGVDDLTFSDMFKSPVGPRGFELSNKLRALAGKRVRLTGYMVRQCDPVAGGFLLSPVPMSLHPDEYGLADDLPATAVHVFIPEKHQIVPFQAGAMSVVGTVETGSREEADGRVSQVRLLLTPPAPTASNTVPVTARAAAH